MTARTPRPAYTLFEVVLVCAVLVIVAALAYPSLRAMQGPYRLQGAVDSVRSAWATARARAIEEGRPYRFAVEPGGSHYRVAPDQQAFWNGEGSSGQGGFVMQQALPAGVRFSINSEAGSLPPDPADDRATQTAPSGGNWSSAAVFLPDGTAREDLKITFQVRGARPTTLFLRGLTGNVTVLTNQP